MNFSKYNSYFEKKENRINFGFSLIEMVVVVGSLGIIIVAVISTILLTFRSQNMVKSNNKISENGRSILAELRRNVFNGDSSYITCGVAGIGTSVVIKNQKDGIETTLACFGNNIITSQIGVTTYLNSNEVTVNNCTKFAQCYYKGVGSSEVVGVGFSFGLITTTVGVGSSQLFNTTVTTRN